VELHHSLGKILTVNEHYASVKMGRKWRTDGMAFLGAGLTPMDFFMWEHLKGRLYAVPASPVEDFVARLQ
jgi:hypothetical protein